LRATNTPGWYRLAGAVAVILIVAFAALAATAAGTARASSATIESNVAPSLIAVQNLSASVAEANAAATAVFLSGATGEEDRPRRVLYLDARQRAARQVAEVAGLTGDDPVADEALQRIAVALTDYSARIDASRTANRLGDDAADDTLRSALDLTGTEIAGAVADLTDHDQALFDDNAGRGSILTVAAFAVGAVAVVALVWIQFGVFHRSNRLFNIGLVAATVLLAVTLALGWSGSATRVLALDNARSGGYDSIVTTSRLQSSAYQLQSQLSLGLLGEAGPTTTDGDDPQSLITALDAEVAAVRAEADSTREQAAADELAVRWERYRQVAESITSSSTVGTSAEAVALFQGAGLSTFNGFNTSIESVLSDNRTQFSDGVAVAASSVDLLPWFSLILPALAAVATVLGIQSRLRDYQ
jgi:hypothetical protein